MNSLRAAILLSACIAMPAHAVLIASDSFATTQGGADYNVGDLRGQTATVGTTGYTGAWNSGTAANQIVSTGLTHSLSPGTPLDGQIIAFTGTGTAERRLSRAINYTPATGTYYLSSLFRKTTASTTFDMLAGLGPLESATSGWATSAATVMGIWNGAFQFSAGGGSFTELLTAAELTVNETFFALMQIDYSSSGADSVTVSVYNGSSSLVANQTFGGLDLDGDIGRFVLGTRDYSPDVGVDEMRFGTQLSDVMVPEPSTLCLTALGLIMALRRRR